MADDALTTVVRDQKRWSLTANALKASLEQSRLTVLSLGIAGAVLETGGAQIHRAHAQWALVLGYAGAAVLAVAAVVRQWKLGHDRTQAWILARAGAESFKREIYLYCTSSGPYAVGNPALTLLDRREEILAKVQPAQQYRIEPKHEIEIPKRLDSDSYLAVRITGDKGQIKYFSDHADQYAATQKRLNGVEFMLAVVAALLGAALTITGKQAYGAWVAVITTVSGAIAAHVLAQRYEQLTVTYRATADRLTGTVGRWKAQGTGSLTELVETCEAVLLQENQGWIAGADRTALPAKQAVAAP
jgi:hypothetical protein